MGALYFDTDTAGLIDITDSLDVLLPPPSHYLELDTLLTTEAFPYAAGDFVRRSPFSWNRDELVKIGTLVARDLIELDPPRPYTYEISRRLGILSLLPGKAILENTFGSHNQFVESIQGRATEYDHRKYTHYDDLDQEELANHFITEYERLMGQQPSVPFTAEVITTLYKLGLTPSESYCKKRFGGIAKLNELLLFPDTKQWDHEQYISYGVEVLRLNGPGSLTFAYANALSQRSLGPASTTIIKRFGAWSEYQQQVNSAVTQANAIRLKNTENAEHFFVSTAKHLGATITSAEERLTIWAKHRLASVCLLGHVNRSVTFSKLYFLPLPNFIQEISNLHPNLNSKSLERTAKDLGIYDVLWPRPYKYRPPIIPRE